MSVIFLSTEEKDMLSVHFPTAKYGNMYTLKDGSKVMTYHSGQNLVVVSTLEAKRIQNEIEETTPVEQITIPDDPDEIELLLTNN